MTYQERIEFVATLFCMMEPGDDEEALKTAMKLWKLDDEQLCLVGDYLRSQWLGSIMRPMTPRKPVDSRALLSKTGVKR